MPDAAILVLTSVPDHAAASSLARTLVTGRLAACVTVGAPVESMYHWQGEIETAREFPVTVKTLARHYDAVEAAILAVHPYELPEILAVPAIRALSRYVEWIDAETQPR